METPSEIQTTLDDPKVTDICINGPKCVFADRGNGLEKLSHPIAAWTEEEFKAWVIELITRAGKSWDAKHPFIDATLTHHQLNGMNHRLHVAFPPLAKQGILVSLRRLPENFSQPKQGFKRWGRSGFFSMLFELIEKGESVLISGATGSGKTTLATDLLEAVPASERIIALEDTPELAPCHPHFLTLLSRPPNADGFGEVTLRTLLRQALRMRPDRIILGECRGAEVLELLQALNTGHKGALATLHANNPRDALRRIELLCVLAGGGNLPIGAVRELLAVGVQWIAQVRREGPQRIITELWKIEGREGDTILMRPMVQPF